MQSTLRYRLRQRAVRHTWLSSCKDELKEIPRAQRMLHRPSLMALFTKAVQGEKVLRDEAIRKACLDYGYSMAAIARHAGVHCSTVSKVIKGEG